MKRLSLFLFLVPIIALNLFVIAPYMAQSFPQWISSIEVGFITMGQWLAQYFPHYWWLPQWYTGIPLHLLYTPLIPALTAILGSALGNFGQAYHLIAGVAYILVPVSLFFFIHRLTRSPLVAFAGSFFFSVAPTFGLLFPQVHTALFGPLAHWRLIILVYYGESPHTASIIFFLPSALFALTALEKKSSSYIILSAIFLALTALTNPIGLFAGLVLLSLVFFSWGLVTGNWRQTIFSGLKTVFLAAGLAAFWYNPSFLRYNLASEGGQVGSELFQHFPWRFLLFFALGASLTFLVKKLVHTAEAAIAIFWFLFMFALLGSFYYFGITLVPQVRRFIVELDMAAATLIAVFLHRASVKISHRFLPQLKLPLISIIFSLLLVVAGLSYFFSYLPTVDWFIKRGPFQQPTTLSQLREYELANWLKQHTQPTDRIFVSANYTFWLNFFTDVWQLRGSHFQASLHPWEPHAGYQVTAGDDGATSILWAKIFNLRYLVVNPENSLIHYQDYYYPQKFASLLPPVGQIREDIIYEVNDLPGLARVVDSSQALSLSPPQDGADSAALSQHLNWLTAGPSLAFHLISPDTYQIQGRVGESQAARVAIAYARGWQAKDDVTGQSLSVTPDPLGFILVTPASAQPLTSFTLNYFPPIEVWLGVIASLLTLIGLGVYLLTSQSHQP